MVSLPVVCKTTRKVGTYREKHVLLILVDSTGVRDGVSMFDHRHGLPCQGKSREIIEYHTTSQVGREPQGSLSPTPGSTQDHTKPKLYARVCCPDTT